MIAFCHKQINNVNILLLTELGGNCIMLGSREGEGAVGPDPLPPLKKSQKYRCFLAILVRIP